MARLDDGGGSGRSAIIDSEKRLLTRSVIEAQEQHANEKGDAYNLNTNSVTLTDAVDTPILYLKNNELLKDFIITAVVLGFAGSTGGTASEAIEVTFIRNPTTGTIITSTPTNLPIKSNRNYGSSNTLTADAFLGATGDTMTDGDDHIYVFTFPKSRVLVPINEILPKGSSLGIKIKPQSSNTSMAVYVAVICFIQEIE